FSVIRAQRIGHDGRFASIKEACQGCTDSCSPSQPERPGNVDIVGLGGLMASIRPRKGMPSVKLAKARYHERMEPLFYDPAFAPLRAEVERISDAGWDGYANSRKSPQTRPAGPGHADPEYDLSVEWIAQREAIRNAERQWRFPSSRSRVLLIN